MLVIMRCKSLAAETGLDKMRIRNSGVAKAEKGIECGKRDKTRETGIKHRKKARDKNDLKCN